MEALKRELERKRKLYKENFGDRKFVRRGEIEQKTLEHLRKEEKIENEKKFVKVRSDVKEVALETEQNASQQGSVKLLKSGSLDAATEDAIDSLVLSRVEVVRRLRLLKHPITLFGEDDDARLLRLKGLMKAGVVDPENELMEGQRNDFLKDMTELKKSQKEGRREQRKDKSREKGNDTKDAGGAQDGVDGAGSGDEGSSDEEDDIDIKRLRAEYNELCDEDKILVFFKKLLKEWKRELDERPEAEKRTTKGKSVTATFKQCARYIDPLFKLCRRKQLYDDIQEALMFMVTKCRERDYLVAFDKYIKLAIGNSPWPIGVTMVGIHERSAREKIHTNSVAHIMNDEVTRKYFYSVKRLMTLCQRKYPALPSKSVEFNSLANGSDLQSLLADEQVQKVNQTGQTGSNLLRLEPS